ncbi:nucleoside deaminase [Kribbella sp. NPDC056861]|uniref:nucleoside deaminase n=1 Tax=Kribbella sp. NPDC056861 TaxID=3154857 RepID=UPI00341AA05F
MLTIWQQPFALAWEALQAKSFPVGAVLLNPAGNIALTGRNRSKEPAAPASQLANTALAHAEVNVLAQLPPGSHSDWTMLTSLQPCLLCLSALRLAQVGNVTYAGADPLWDGCAQVPSLLPDLLSSKWPVSTGPADGMDGVWGILLPAIWYVAYKPAVVAAPSDLLPWATVELARECVTAGILDSPSGAAAYDLASALLHHRS